MNASRTLFDLPVTLSVVTALGSGIVGGVFFGFSTFVMKGLGRLPPAQGIAAMQSINLAAPSPLFMGALFGTALAGIGLGISALTRLDEPAARYQLIGSALYLGVVVLTAAYHVPRNDALAAIDPQAVGAVEFWRDYASSWTAWNHVRTALALAAAGVLTVGIRVA